MSHYLVDRIENTDNIEVWLHHDVVECKGDGSRLEALDPDPRTTADG